MSGVVSVGVALGSAAIAATDVAAVGFTVGTAFEVAGAVGATVGAVGALTHNKALMLGGAALGVVGGVGSLAAGAGLFDSASAAGDVSAGGAAGSGAGGEFTTADATGMAGAANGMPSTADAGVVPGGASTTAGGTSPLLGPPAPTDVSTTGMPTGLGNPGASAEAVNGTPVNDLINQLAGGNEFSNPNQIAPTGIPTTSNGIAVPQGDPTEGAAGAPGGSPATQMGYDPNHPVVAPASPGAQAPASPQGPLLNPSKVEAPTIPSTNAAAGTGLADAAKGAYNTDSGSVWQSVLEFVKKNPALALGGLSAASSFLAGATSPLTPAQVNALNAQATKSAADTRLADTQTAMLSRQLANVGQPMPIARRG